MTEQQLRNQIESIVVSMDEQIKSGEVDEIDALTDCVDLIRQEF